MRKELMKLIKENKPRAFTKMVSESLLEKRNQYLNAVKQNIYKDKADYLK